MSRGGRKRRKKLAKTRAAIRAQVYEKLKATWYGEPKSGKTQMITVIGDGPPDQILALPSGLFDALHAEADDG